MSARRRIVVVSPHFDDVPLSLGQSLLDGALSRCTVRVRVAFGRTNWTGWVHPTRRRAPAVSLWRRLEETAAAVRFGYRWRAGRWEESVLRTGRLDPAALLDAARDLTAEPLVDELAGWIEDLVRPADRAPATDLLLVCAGLGGHVDHRIVAAAAARVAPGLDVPVGVYEDRPYAAYLEPAERAAAVERLLGPSEAVEVSGAVRAGTQRWVRRCYPSQMDDYFTAAMARDLASGDAERVWFPRGRRPEWLGQSA